MLDDYYADLASAWIPSIEKIENEGSRRKDIKAVQRTTTAAVQEIISLTAGLSGTRKPDALQDTAADQVSPSDRRLNCCS